MEVSRELAFFGGWTRRVLAGGSHAWGSPHQRVMELAPSSASSIRMPPASPWRQPGVPYWVINTGAAGLQIRNANDVLIDGAGLSAGEAGVLHGGAGESWHFRLLGAAQFGSVVPAQRMEIEVTATTANIHVLHWAVLRGYDGTQPIAVTLRIRSGVAVGTAALAQRAITSGVVASGINWAAGSQWRLIVEPDAIVGGWGGAGGRGGVAGTGSSNGFAGQNGGQAIRTTLPLVIDCLGNGTIFGGGGGGGGGGSAAAPTPVVAGGGGGGGRGLNMTVSGALTGSIGGGASSPAQPGPVGGAFSPGWQQNPGTPPPAFVGGLGVGGGGYGGAGGAAASVGSPGAAAPSAGTGGAGGAAGAAISYLAAAGAPVVLWGGANIVGATVAEAS
jgi:hypothetical protein